MDHSKLITDTDEVRKSMNAARERNRKWRRKNGERSMLSPYGDFRPAPTPEHYHIIYSVPAEGVAIPYMAEVFMEEKEVYARIKEMGDASEPNTEWYDDGSAQIETRLHGRTGMWRVILEPTRCIRRSCRPNLPREAKKGSLVLLPGATKGSGEDADITVIMKEVPGDGLGS